MASQQSDLELRPVEGFPECEIGAPMPMVIGSEDALVLLYVASVEDPAWDGTYARVLTPETKGLPIAVVTFKRAVAHVLSTVPGSLRRRNQER